jgi:hypothetical protein
MSSLFKITKVGRPNVGAACLRRKSYVLNLGWASFWADFSQAHLVTLFVGTEEDICNACQSRKKICRAILLDTFSCLLYVERFHI